MDIKKYKAILFDCDGTLADTTIAHKKAYREIFNDNNLPFNKEIFYKNLSHGSLKMLNYMTKGKYSIDTLKELNFQKNNIIERYLDQYMVINQMLIRHITSHFYGKYKLAVVSNASKVSVNHVIKKCGLGGKFHVILSKEDVRKLKPHPEIYLKASELLDVEPSYCQVFEDSLAGITSAKRAKMDTVKIKVRTCNKNYSIV